MFCSRCGKEASEASKYCSACGFSPQQSSVAGPSGIDSEAKQPVVKSPMNFQEFLKRKAESRKEHFKFRPKSAKKVEKDVSINIGIMRYVNGTLKFCRGRNLPVTVPSSASRDDILTKAVTKHANHDKNLIRDDLRYTLLYPDGTEVKTLPGSSDCFILHKFLFAAPFSYLQHLFYLQQLFFCSNFFYLQQLFLFAATFFICSNFFYLQQLFLFAATFFICSNFFFCSNFFYLQQLFLFAATFFYLQQLFLFAATFFLFAATSFFICSNLFYLYKAQCLICS